MNLPPLAAIRAFEAAARLSSFTRAGEELAMTQAAVSYQVKVLEDRIGQPLFVRRARQVELTDTGRALAAGATEALRLLADSYERARSGGQGTLSITTIPTFAANWFALHLGSFQIAHPSIAVRLAASDTVVDLARDNFDVGIRSGDTGRWPGLAAHRLFPADFTPMLNPGLAASIGGIREPADLLKLPIIDAGDSWWPIWFDLAGIDVRDILARRPHAQFGSQAFVGRAAAAGRGVAIVSRALFAAELASGSLIQPFDIVGNDGHAYWLVYQEARRNVPKIKAFRDWMLKAIAATTGQPRPD